MVTDSSSQTPFQPSSSSWKMQSFGTPAVTFSFIAWAVIFTLHSGDSLRIVPRAARLFNSAILSSKNAQGQMEFFSSQIRITRITGENRALLTTVIDPFYHHNDSTEH
jgi:hypothetical protein